MSPYRKISAAPIFPTTVLRLAFSLVFSHADTTSPHTFIMCAHRHVLRHTSLRTLPLVCKLMASTTTNTLHGHISTLTRLAKFFDLGNKTPENFRVSWVYLSLRDRRGGPSSTRWRCPTMRLPSFQGNCISRPITLPNAEFSKPEPSWRGRRKMYTRVDKKHHAFSRGRLHWGTFPCKSTAWLLLL